MKPDTSCTNSIGMPLAVAAVDEVRHLLGALRVHDSAEARLLAGAALDQPALIGDHADGNARDARVAADHLARECP